MCFRIFFFRKILYVEPVILNNFVKPIAVTAEKNLKKNGHPKISLPFIPLMNSINQHFKLKNQRGLAI